jgi:hypothetical protein
MQSQGFLCGARQRALSSLGYSLFRNAYAFADFHLRISLTFSETPSEGDLATNLDGIGPTRRLIFRTHRAAWNVVPSNFSRIQFLPFAQIVQDSGRSHRTRFMKGF